MDLLGKSGAALNFRPEMTGHVAAFSLFPTYIQVRWHLLEYVVSAFSGILLERMYFFVLQKYVLAVGVS
jgi:hypothetical protein